MLRQSRAQADADPVERSDIDPADKLAILQDSDEWSAIPGYPGPATPATDEIYYAFIIPDMMAKAATGQLSAEDSVKWATRQCEAIFKKWAGKA